MALELAVAITSQGKTLFVKERQNNVFLFEHVFLLRFVQITNVLEKLSGCTIHSFSFGVHLLVFLVAKPLNSRISIIRHV